MHLPPARLPCQRRERGAGPRRAGPPRRGPAGWSEDTHLGRRPPLLPPALWRSPLGESVQAVVRSSRGRCSCSLGLSRPEVITRFSSAAFPSRSSYQSWYLVVPSTRGCPSFGTHVGSLWSWLTVSRIPFSSYCFIRHRKHFSLWNLS